MDDRGRTDPQPHVLFLFVSLYYWADNTTMSTSNIPPIMCSHI